MAPDWSADWLHREASEYREIRSHAIYGAAYAQLALFQRGAVDALVKEELRRNTYDPATGVVTVTPERAAGHPRVARHYEGLFGDAPELGKLRERYAMGDNLLPREGDRKALAAFLFWSAWAASTDRPGDAASPTRATGRTSR